MTGDMRLGAIPAISPFLLPKVLPSVKAKYPGLRLYLCEEQTAVLFSRLRDGDLDVALVALPYDTENFAVSILFDDAFLFACHTEHPLPRHKLIKNDDLQEQPLLLLEEGHCLPAFFKVVVA